MRRLNTREEEFKRKLTSNVPRRRVEEAKDQKVSVKHLQVKFGELLHTNKEIR